MSKKRFIDSVRVAKPCTESWNEMNGTDKIRFCSHCAKDVKNLSAMTRKEAMRIVSESNGGICIRYEHDRSSSRPIFADRLFQITRRAPGLAAGVMSASIALSSSGYGQSSSRPGDTPPPANIVRPADTSAKPGDDIPKGGSVLGTVLDQYGAVIAGRVVVLTNEATKETRTQTSNEYGGYRFENVPDGSYRIVYKGGAGFEEKEVRGVTVSGGIELAQIAELQINPRQLVTMGMMASTRVVEYKNPVTAAVQNEDVDELRDLIARGANVNEKEDDGTSPLAAAVENGNLEIVRILLDFGAKVNARDDDKRTPLMMLDDDASVELASALIDAGAKVKVTDDEGNTPLILAARDVKPDVLKVLIDAGADVNAANDNGVTALMNAARDEDIEKVRLLLHAGADVNAKDKEGETAWDKTSDDDIEDLLVGYGAQVNDDNETNEPTAH